MFQLKRTPFHERTSKLCLPQNWRRWAGYLVVGSYELTLDREYWAIRNSAALIDVTPLMKYIINGKDARRLLNRVVTRDMDKLKVGQVYYVVSGRAKILVAEENREVQPGSIVYVAKNVAHRFHSIEEDLTVLVFFAPAEYSNK